MENGDSGGILLTGATGYLGGSILANILKSNSSTLQHRTVTCLLRGEDRIARLKAAYGDRIEPVLYQGLDELDKTMQVASEHDVVINAAYGFHIPSATALLEGLAKRKRESGRDVFLMHISGTSSLADQRLSGEYVDEDRVFDDLADDMYAYEKEREAKHQYDQRTADLKVIDLGLELGVKVVIVMPPTIYGIGQGQFNQHSAQIAAHIQATVAAGYAFVIDDGKGAFDYVHILDLADLYVLMLLDILEENGKHVPFGKQGIVFAGTGWTTWHDVAENIAKVAYQAKRIDSPMVTSVSLRKGAELLCGGNEQAAEINLTTNARTRAAIARRLGWNPSRGSQDWVRGFGEEMEFEMTRDPGGRKNIFDNAYAEKVSKES